MKEAPVTSEEYFKIFQNDTTGIRVFEELCSIYYDIDAYEKGDPYHTSYQAGQRSVIKYIINKMMISQEDRKVDNNVIPEE